ncbi:MAG: hypothetical protein OHK0022_61600 [Roseiflexaceae bacterium]
MNDDFLERFREPPRPEFAQGLYRRLARQPEQPRAPSRLAATLVLLVLLVSVGLLGGPHAAEHATGTANHRLIDEALVASAHQPNLLAVLEVQHSPARPLLMACPGCPRDLAVRRVVNHHR